MNKIDSNMGLWPTVSFNRTDFRGITAEIAEMPGQGGWMNSPDTEKQKVLLIGDMSGVFAEDTPGPEFQYVVRSSIQDAVETSVGESFFAIAVTMDLLCHNGTALKLLREANPSSKIILFAQMYQEPEAIELLKAGSNGQSTADDYLVCPVTPEKLSRSLVPSADAAINFYSDRKMARLVQLATTDGLTGLKNRRYLWEFARQVIARARQDNAQVTLLVFDIDNFKHYNDQYSHLAGDEILKQAAVLIQRCCRNHDVVGRIGGDEFAVVFWDDPRRKSDAEQERRSFTANHPSEPLFIATRFRKELENAELPMLGPEGKGVLAISGGLATFPRDGVTIQELFKQADKALLQAKKAEKTGYIL